MLILFTGILSNNAYGVKWLGANPGDSTRYLIDLVVDPLPRTLESFGLRYLSADSDNAMSIEINAGPIMGLFLPRIITVNVETGQVLDNNVPHKSWIYWLPASKQLGDTVLLDFGEVYNLSTVELTVKELGVRSFQKQKVDVYVAEGASDGKTVSYVVESSRGVVLEALLKDDDRVLFDGKLVETNVTMQEASKATVKEEPVEQAPIPSPTKEEEKQREVSISVAMKEKKKLTLIAVKNLNDIPVYGVKVKASDAKIKFVKVRDWERERIDQSTVIVQTTDKPLAKGTLILMVIVDKKGSGLEWSVTDKIGVQIASGSLVPE